MPESIQHMQLVQRLLMRVREKVNKNLWAFIQSDEASSQCLPPKMISGYRPDVYYQFDKLFIIGEAKTSNDISSLHSKAQYETYIKSCASFNGEALLLIAVPWTDVAEANNVIRKIQKDINSYCEFEIISNLEYH